ncbi:fasciclin domain-containing protein [Phnomibacter sp. MR]|uniref:fasciclin domain-containing protein n=1 Tax=Phnomibacter sp. MR TaxID=3042318 RepID=UPI003A7FECA4
MKRKFVIPALLLAVAVYACTSPATENAAATTETRATAPATGQSGVQDDVSNPNVVQVAVSSKDHSTLVTAVKAAGLVDALSNAGPFTVFAPTNAAFDKLPKGTVEDLLKPEKKGDLENILGYHTYVGVLNGALLQDGLEYDMVFGGKVKITKQGDKVFVNGKEIVATITASNGVIHVINEVLLPPAK